MIVCDHQAEVNQTPPDPSPETQVVGLVKLYAIHCAIAKGVSPEVGRVAR